MKRLDQQETIIRNNQLTINYCTVTRNDKLLGKISNMSNELQSEFSFFS